MWFLEVSWPVEQGKFEYATALAQRFLGTSLTLCGFLRRLPIRFQRSCFFGLEPQQETNSLLTQKAIS